MIKVDLLDGQNRMNNGVVILNVAKLEKMKVKVAYLISIQIGQDDGHATIKLDDLAYF